MKNSVIRNDVLAVLNQIAISFFFIVFLVVEYMIIGFKKITFESTQILAISKHGRRHFEFNKCHGRKSSLRRISISSLVSINKRLHSPFMHWVTILPDYQMIYKERISIFVWWKRSPQISTKYMYYLAFRLMTLTGHCSWHHHSCTVWVASKACNRIIKSWNRIAVK